MAKAKGKTQTKRGTSKAAAEAAKQQYVTEYLRNGRNGYRAAIAAGVSPASANQQSWEWRQDPKVVETIKKYEKAIIEANLTDLNKIVATAAEIAAFDIRSIVGERGEMLPPSEWPEHAGRVIASIEVEERFEDVGEERELVGYLKKIKTWSKTQAVEQLLKVLGGYEKDYDAQAKAQAKVMVVPEKQGDR